MYPGPGQQPPYHQQPQYPQPYYPPPQAPPPPPRVVKSVEKQRGLGGCSNSVHLILSICTCGLWLFVWIPWWIIRVLIPRRKTTRHYYG